MKQNITNHNSKGDLHGYQEWYSPTSYKCFIRSNFKNGFVINYCEYHFFSKRTEYHIR